jgi:hypothetical protein
MWKRVGRAIRLSGGEGDGCIDEIFSKIRGTFCRTIFVVGNTIRRPPGNACLYSKRRSRRRQGTGLRQEEQTCENLMLGQEQSSVGKGQLNVAHPSSVGRR